MYRLIFNLILPLMLVGSAFAAEAPAGKAEEAYELVSPPQPTADPGKVEVLEFFWYGCPHCYHFEPDLNAWLKTKPDNVVFIRQPAIFNAHWAAHAKAFFTAEALGMLEKMHADFYDAIQTKKMALESEEDLAKFFVAHGAKKEDFHKAYKSFAVDTKMRQAEGLAAKYGVTGTPTLIVNGKYRVSASQSKTFTNMIATTKDLVKKESHGKAAK